MKEFSGKVALITRAASGIGRMTALASSSRRTADGLAAMKFCHQPMLKHEAANRIGRRLISAAADLQADPARVEIWRAKIDRILPRLSSEALYDAFHALLPLRRRADLPRVLPLLDAGENDTRVAAAWTVLAVVGGVGVPTASPIVGAAEGVSGQGGYGVGQPPGVTSVGRGGEVGKWGFDWVVILEALSPVRER